jgi:hypothetical protein
MIDNSQSSPNLINLNSVYLHLRGKLLRMTTSIITNAASVHQLVGTESKTYATMTVRKAFSTKPDQGVKPIRPLVKNPPANC